MLAPQTFLVSDEEIGIVCAFCPCERCGHVETNPFSSESDFPRFQNEQKDHVAQSSCEQRTDARSEPRICFHQSWHCQAGDDSRDDSADRYPVWNDEMLEINKCPDDQERNTNPIRDGRLPGEGPPDDEKKERSEQFHGKIAKGDFRAAICAATTKHDPADQWQVVMPGYRFLARRAKRAARAVDRKIDRQTINADVQERADRGAKDKSEHAEEKFVNG